jgi:hypothetical protein
MIRRLDLPTLRAAFWTLRALRVTRHQLRRGSIEGVEIPSPPPLPGTAIRGVKAVLRRLPNSCLERSLILQRWLRKFGSAPDVVVGVSGPTPAFKAHAWLDGEADGEDGHFQELLRIPGAERH